MNNKTESFKEKLRQALSSTARVISDDLGINPKKKIKNSEKQDLIELDSLNSKDDFIKARAETDSKALKKKFSNEKSFFFLSSTLFLFISKSSAITFAVEFRAILNFSFKLVSFVLI